jgi:hypothetical protein
MTPRLKFVTEMYSLRHSGLINRDIYTMAFLYF